MKGIGSFYDKGLFYRSPIGFECISGPARNALIPLLSKAISQNLPPINSVQDPKERGIVHEKWIVSQFISGKSITMEVIYFDTVDKIAPNLENRQRLYIPTDMNHPSWDCIYDGGTSTAFFSFSISPFWNGHDTTTMNSFERDEETGEISYNSKLMDGIRGHLGHNLTISDDGILTTECPNGKQLNVHFFYGCGLPQSHIKEEGGEKRKLPVYRFLKFFGQEEMEKFGVKF